MGYINSLRKKVGNQPLIMVGATVLVLNQKNELLMMKRTDNQCWGVPGGSMEPGERIEETAVRETKEETGLLITNASLFRVFSGPELFYRYPDGAEVYNVSIVYVAKIEDEPLSVNPFEHTEFAFFPLNNLPKPISPPIMPILKAFLEHQVND